MIDCVQEHRPTLNPARFRPEPQGRPVDLTQQRFNLQRFIPSQDAVMQDGNSDLQQGRKTSHWMGFVFPRLATLGVSPALQRFSLASLQEARAYLEHPILGERLRQCCGLLLRLGEVSALDVFGHDDHLKFHACLTLFHLAAPRDAVFTSCLAKYYGGKLEPMTQLCCGPVDAQAES